jgi:hypothetical protein
MKLEEFRRDARPLVGKVGDGTDGIYVGRMRRSTGQYNPLGNPFRVGEDGTREECIDKFREWLREQVKKNRHVWLSLLAALYQERLICHCAPLPCHAEVLVEAAEWAWYQVGGVEFPPPPVAQEPNVTLERVVLDPEGAEWIRQQTDGWWEDPESELFGEVWQYG